MVVKNKIWLSLGKSLMHNLPLQARGERGVNCVCTNLFTWCKYILPEEYLSVPSLGLRQRSLLATILFSMTETVSLKTIGNMSVCQMSVTGVTSAAISCTGMGKLELPVNLTCMCLDCGRKLSLFDIPDTLISGWKKVLHSIILSLIQYHLSLMDSSKEMISRNTLSLLQESFDRFVRLLVKENFPHSTIIRVV